MGVDWKVPRGRNWEDESPWPLRGSDGGRSVGQTARGIEAPERAGRAAAILTDKLQVIRFERLPSPAAQKVEGLNRPDNNRTNSNTFARSLREFRVGGSHPGSAPDIPRSEGAVAVAKRGEPPPVGLKRHLQNGGGRRDYSREPRRFARYTERGKDPDQTDDDQGTGLAGVIRLGSKGKDHLSAGGLGRDEARRNSRATLGKG